MSSSVIQRDIPVVRKSVALYFKRMLDITGAAIGLVLLSPTFLVVALCIKLHDGGPVIFRRRMVGHKGEFFLYKFRSMCMNADEVLRNNPELRAEFEKNCKLANDPRITPVGRFIRKTSLDELPQLLNVLFGRMSLVGPRSIPREELARYGDAQYLYLMVRPGLSGYWQTEGRSNVSYEQRVAMDAEYVCNWSLLWDLKILLKTPLVVIKGVGAC